MHVKDVVGGLVFTNVVRFIKLFPNNDPIMGVMLPHARKNALHAALFAFIAMVVFDIFTSGIGVWTWVTAFTYAALALLAGFYFKNKKVHYATYVGASIVGVIIFDIITGPLLSTFIFNQNLLFTVFAQIPFTLSHLVSAVSYTIVLAPVLDLDVRTEVLHRVALLKNQLVLLSKQWKGFF